MIRGEEIISSIALKFSRTPSYTDTTSGDRALSVCAPKSWNGLRNDAINVENVKKNLKTY